MLYSASTINRFEHLYTFAQLMDVFEKMWKSFEKSQINDEYSSLGGPKGAAVNNFECVMLDITFQPSKQAFADVISYLKRTI